MVTAKAVLAALEERADESPEGARRLVAQVCDADRDNWTCLEPADPPATFWRDPARLTYSGSDVTNPAAALAEGDLDPLPGIGPAFMFGFVAVTLRGSVAWEAIAALRPEIGPPPTLLTETSKIKREKRKGPRPQPQSDRARRALRRLYPNGSIPGRSEITDKALTASVEVELPVRLRKPAKSLDCRFRLRMW
jgi:hypothetical protein